MALYQFRYEAFSSFRRFVFINVKIINGISIKCNMIPGQACINAPVKNILKVNTCESLKTAKMKRAIPQTIRPDNIEIIKTIYNKYFFLKTASLNILNNNPETNPYVASSKAIDIAVGYIGGI